MEFDKEKIAKLVELAKIGHINPDIDWKTVSDEFYITIAVNVMNQIDSIDESDKETIMQAMIVKLLAENLILNKNKKDTQ